MTSHGDKKHGPLRGLLGALGPKALSLATALAVMTPSLAQAVPFQIGWRDYQYADSSELGGIDSANYFTVDGTPLITPAVQTSQGLPDPSGDGAVTFVSITNFDSGLLTCGSNTFKFNVADDTGDDTGVHVHEQVNLGPPGGATAIPLFTVDRDGASFSGATSVPLSLTQINPSLAKDIAALQQAIDDANTALDAHAASVPDLAAQQTELQNLQNDLDALAAEPLDQITQADLDALLARYSDIVTPAIQTALDAFVNQMKQAVADLQTQLTSLVEQYSQIADEAASLATQGVTGWDIDDPSNYGLTADGSTIPGIPVPDFSQTAGAFDPNNDPYAAYATAVIARLDASVQGDTIPGDARPQFASVVRSWRVNEAALQAALTAWSGVSQAETNAFLNAQNRVLGAIHPYMDSNDWFLQNPVAQAIRSIIDGALKQAFAGIPADLQLVQDVKDGMNDWVETTPTPNEDLYQRTVEAIGLGSTDPQFDDLLDFDTYAEMRAALAQVRTILRASVQVLTSETPVGIFNSMCECITGWEYCTSTGERLSTFERVASCIDGPLASVNFWNKASEALAAGEDIAANERIVAHLNSELGLSDREALRKAVGSHTLATLDGLGDEAFTAFTDAGLGASNEVLTSAKVASADALNAPFLALKGGQPPFVPGTNAILGTSNAASYVRFYEKGPGTYSTGSFLTLKSEAAGLTPLQIQQKFALKTVPTNVVDVAFPAGEPVAIAAAAGTANGNTWGAGGGFQVFWNRANINWSQYTKYFTNDRPIGAVFGP